MMNPGTFLVCVTAIIYMSAGCEKNNSVLPECVTSKIQALKNEARHNPPVEVWQYEYNGKMVYKISSYCCDAESVVIDENCNTLCSPDGGISGRGDGKCPEFNQEAKSGRLVWKDDR
jgi:hypothetical protein